MKILIAQASSKQMQKTLSLMKEKMEGKYQNFSQGVSQHIAQSISVEICGNKKLPITCADIRKSEADLFINFDLAGFEQSTLTDGIAYNLLDCKQIHILLRDKLPGERYLAKQLSISMFFYCADLKYCQYLQSKYPDMPYLKAIEGWKKNGQENREDSIEKNAEIFCDIVREVLEICRMLP